MPKSDAEFKVPLRELKLVDKNSCNNLLNEYAIERACNIDNRYIQ